MSSIEIVFAKLKIALLAGLNYVLFYTGLMRRTAESNCYPFSRIQLGINQRSAPADDILHILRESYYTKINNLSQEGEVIYFNSLKKYAVPQLIPSNNQYSKRQTIVKQTLSDESQIIIPANGRHEILDLTLMSEVAEDKKLIIKASKGSQVTYVLALFGGQAIKKDVMLELAADAEGTIVVIVMAQDKAHFNINTALHHTGPNTKGNIAVRAVLKDTAHLQYTGMIKIEKSAQLTNSFLEGKALALDRGVVCNAEPELEIEANDVKASHSFSQSQIDSEQLFYLRTRGLREKEAQQMIVEGFVWEVLADIPEEIREKVGRILRENANQTQNKSKIKSQNAK